AALQGCDQDWWLEGHVQIPGRDAQAGSALLVLLHHRRLPRLARPGPRIRHRAHHRPQVEHPRHPVRQARRCCPSARRRKVRPPGPPRLRRHPQRPLAVAVQDPVAQARQAQRDAPH
ncbi:hypothetical protein LTR16_012132, partial [Cryomyces antarcticus]